MLVTETTAETAAVIWRVMATRAAVFKATSLALKRLLFHESMQRVADKFDFLLKVFFSEMY